MTVVRRYALPMLRLSCFVAALAVLLGYVDYRVARASIMERMLGLGQRMAPFLDDARGTEAPRELHVNGVRLWAAAGHTSQPPAMVRRWYAERYAGQGSAMDAVTRSLAALRMVPRGADGASQASFGDDHMGGMAALELTSLGGKVTLKSLGPILRKLATGQIGEVGHLRYLYFERTGDGGTRYLTVWTDDQFDLAKMLPDGSGDTPGRDIDNVPRYPGTVRVLASDERGRTGQIAVYSGAGSPEMAAIFYDARMRTLGWQADPHFAVAASAKGLHSSRYVDAKGHEVVIDLSDDHDGQGLTVTAIALR